MQSSPSVHHRLPYADSRVPMAISRLRPILRGAVIGTLALCIADYPRPAAARNRFRPLLGDVTATAAVVWVGDLDPKDACLDLELRSVVTGSRHTAAVHMPSGGGASHRFDGLQPDTEYEIRVPAWSPDSRRRFRTAPAPDAEAAVSIACSGDIGGQGIGRDLVEGLPICAAILERSPHVFLGLGDMIYGDRSIPARSRLGNLQLPLRNGLLLSRLDYLAHWRYLHDDPGFAALLAATSYVACWDDHECVNNFGPGDDWGLLATARQAMLDWNPILGPAGDAGCMYRQLSWGRRVDMFVLDCRSHRLRADLPDLDPDPKTMLGDAQRNWLLAALERSRATWKIIVSSVPLTAPTGDPIKGRDGWADHGSATGYERELLDLLRAMQQLGIRRPLFVCADVHHAEVLELQPFDDAPDFQPLEIVVGPMNAGCFGRDTLDPTLRPRSLFYLDPHPQPRTLAQAKRFWNFGLLQFAPNGEFTLEIVDAGGETRFRRSWRP
jgi:alkaline phosphatase D